MKMYMPLIAGENGIAQFVKQPGTSLAPGDIVGILALDDPARVKHAKPFEGLLPSYGAPGVIGSKPNQRFSAAVEILNNILDGYDNQAIMAATLKDLISILDDPSLPFSELTAVLSILSWRRPQKLEETIRATLDAALAKTVTEFPALRIRKQLDAYLSENVKAQDRPAFRTQLGAIFDIAERYRSGLKSAKWATMSDFLAR